MPAAQEIRFCTGADGARLAAASLGAGPPLLMAAAWLTHLEFDLDMPGYGNWIQALARKHRVLRYDARGNGLSQREVERIDLDAWVEDLLAVADAFALKRFDLFGLSQGAAVAAAFAARHPERVQRLVLYGGCARGLLKRDPPPKVVNAARAMLDAAEFGWGSGSSAFRQMFLDQLVRTATPQQRRDMDERQRRAVSGPIARKFIEAAYGVDVRELAPRVAAPTLCAHCDEDPCFPFAEGALLAALIPGARLVRLSSQNHLLMEDEPAWAVMLGELERFLSGPDGDAVRLTQRQHEVLLELAAGGSDKAIARKLALSPRTVEMHVANLLTALECGTRAQAVRRASELGLL